MTIYDNIDALLKEKHMSRRKLARLARINETTLAACFSRRPEHFPSKYAIAIARVLDVDVAALYGTQSILLPVSEVMNAAKSLKEGTSEELRQRIDEIEQKELDNWLQLEKAVNAYLRGENISADLKRFLDAYKQLNPSGREQALLRIEEMIHNDLYRKPIDSSVHIFTLKPSPKEVTDHGPEK